MNLAESIEAQPVDELIRKSLRIARSRGKLHVLANITRIDGGVQRLREIVESKAPLPHEIRMTLQILSRRQNL
jgi:hypothetical protein